MLCLRTACRQPVFGLCPCWCRPLLLLARTPETRLHKTVCGAKAKPFLFPPLSTAQVASLRQNRPVEQSFLDWSRAGGMSLDYNRLLTWLGERPPRDQAWEWFRMNFETRLNINRTRTTLSVEATPDLTSVWQVFPIIAAHLIQAVEMDGMVGGTVLDAEWWQDALHRQLMILTLCELVSLTREGLMNGDEATARRFLELDDYMGVCLRELLEWCAHAVGPGPTFLAALRQHQENLAPLDEPA